MKVTVRYFASLREALGASETAEVAPGSTLSALRAQLMAQSPRHAELLGRQRAVRCALNQVLCGEDAAITAAADGAEVAFFPPVTGG